MMMLCSRLMGILVLSLFLSILSHQAHAQIPTTLNYQGHISPAGGGSYTGPLDIKFSIYRDKTQGVALWTEEHSAANGNAVEVVNGNFNVILGSLNPIDLAFDEQYYLGIWVLSDSAEMNPRLPFSTGAYAFNADHAANADHATNSDHASNSDHADQATNSDHASNADNANHATNADYATTAGMANSVADGSISLLSLDPTECANGEVFRRVASGNGWECSTAEGPQGPEGPAGPVGPEGPAGIGLGDLINTAIVTKGLKDGTPITLPGIYTDPVVAMNDIANWCNPIAGNCLLKIMPGDYDITASGHISIDYTATVAIEGSGEGATTIRNTAGLGLIEVNSSPAQISSLTLESSGPAGSSSVAVVSIGPGQTSLNSVTINTDGMGIDNSGPYISRTGTVLSHVNVNAVEGVLNAAGAAMTIMDSTFTDTAGSTGAQGVKNDGGNVNLSSVSIDVRNGTGIRNAGGEVTVDHSSISAHTAILSDPGSTGSTNVGGSMLQGTISANTNIPITCAFSYDQNYQPLNTNCN
jgi:hypothetical protein